MHSRIVHHRHDRSHCNRRVALLLTLLTAFALLAPPAQADQVEMPQGNYLRSTVDLAVKVLGGKVRVWLGSVQRVAVAVAARVAGVNVWLGSVLAS